MKFAIRSSQNLFMLEKAILETDPETTDVVVMTAKLLLPGSESNHLFEHGLRDDDRAMLVEVASKMGIVGIQHTAYDSTKARLAELGLTL